MKLIDILVEETIENSWSWPEHANCITQDHDREIMPATCQPCVAKFDVSFNRWFLNGSRIDCFTADVLASYYETAIITRDQYESALAAKNDGWIEWGGGECPVECGTVVDVKYRDGVIKKGLRALIANSGRSASRLFWVKDNIPTDIIAYRLHQPTKSEQVRADALNAYAGIEKVNDEADLNECIGQAPVEIWNGEGLPPVGCECEYTMQTITGDDWNQCTVDYVGSSFVVYRDCCGVELSCSIGCIKFRPILSEAERKREKAVQALCNAGGGNGKVDEKVGYGSCWFDVYDAIAAGKIPGVKLEV